MKFGSTTTRGDATFDLTPMIDVILLLIVFFMLSSQFSRTDRLELDLPKERGDETASEEQPSELILDLTRNGSLLVDSRFIEFSDLPAILGGVEAAARVDKPTIIVRADRLARAEHLNRLASELSRLGISGWQFATMPTGGAPPAGAVR